MLYVHLVGLIKEIKLIKMQGVKYFKMGSAPGKRWVLELSGYAVVECLTQISVTNHYHSTAIAITFIPQYPAIITGFDISVVRTDVFTGLSITNLVMNM
jgi:hypothetical protein